MTILAKESIINRDNNGELLLSLVSLELMPKDKNGDYFEVEILPMTKSELKQFFLEVSKNEGETSKDKDHIMIRKFVKNPKFEDDDLFTTPQKYIEALVYAVISTSTGIPQKDLFRKSTEEIINKVEGMSEKK